MGNQDSEEKTHLEECLNYYTGLDAPGYAFLVTGEWGAGKTYQVKKYISEDNRLYVSLYGLQTVEQLHSELIAASDPSMATVEKVVKKSSDIVREWTGFPSGPIQSVILPMLRREISVDKTLVFDDLERSNIDQGDVLGAINNYVEHLGFKVVVIAHDKKLTKKMRKMKEKIFGQRIHIEPKIDMVLKDFISGVDDNDARSYLSSQQTEIERIFACSNVKSLRILRHAVENLARLYRTLTDEHRQNTKAMECLSKFFLAFQFEVRSDRISQDDIRSRRGARDRFKYDSKKHTTDAPVIVEVGTKYATIDLESEMLNDNVLCPMLFESRFPTEEIRKSIDNSSEFFIPEDDPPWKIVYHLNHHFDDDIVIEAISELDRQFEGRDVKNAGEMLHIFSLRVWLAEKKIVNKDIRTVFAENNTYIDDLSMNGDLQHCSSASSWDDEFGDSYADLDYRYIHKHRKKMAYTFRKLRAAQISAYHNNSSEIQDKFISEFGENSSRFLAELSATLQRHYSDIAVLHLICPEKFVDVWLELSHDIWDMISSALERRCQTNKREQRFPEEQDWALNVVEELKIRAEKFGLKAYRIKTFLPKVRFLSEYAKPEATQTNEPKSASES